jgi:hypothetical protein
MLVHPRFNPASSGFRCRMAPACRPKSARSQFDPAAYRRFRLNHCQLLVDNGRFPWAPRRSRIEPGRCRRQRTVATHRRRPARPARAASQECRVEPPPRHPSGASAICGRGESKGAVAGRVGAALGNVCRNTRSQIAPPQGRACRGRPKSEDCNRSARLRD